MSSNEQCEVCDGVKEVGMSTGRWNYKVPCPECDPAGYCAGVIDSDHFMIGPAR